MKLRPADAETTSDWEDGFWVERPGYPIIDGSWIHPPPKGHSLPEFEFEEGNDKTKNEPAPVFYVGSGDDCHVRVGSDELPERVCRVFKEKRIWYLEALLPDAGVHHGEQLLEVGRRVALKDNDTFTLEHPPTPLAYRILINEEDNWYFDVNPEKDFPNKYPGRFPWRSSLPEAPPAPEELKRLAWQTDQMRRRSEDDQVRVSDWSAFSQYVKRHYYKHGIECTPWVGTGSKRPIDKKSESFPPRAYPKWIAELVAKERQLPGFDPGRELPFSTSLLASGVKVLEPMTFNGEPPRLQDLYDEPYAYGPAVACAASQRAAPTQSREPAPAPSPKTSSVHLRQSFKEWLEGMDDSMFLMQYHDEIVANYDSLEQIHEIYFRNSELSPAFFDDVGIKKLGHRRIFEKWFRDYG